jgi:hypothetical protein
VPGGRQRLPGLLRWVAAEDNDRVPPPAASAPPSASLAAPMSLILIQQDGADVGAKRAAAGLRGPDACQICIGSRVAPQRQAFRPRAADRWTAVGAIEITRAACREMRTARRHRAHMTDAVLLNTARTASEGCGPRRRTRICRARPVADGAHANVSPPPLTFVLSCPRSGPPPSPDYRPERRTGWRALAPRPRCRGRTHRSPGPHDETNADRCHPRGRNPRGGAGR